MGGMYQVQPVGSQTIPLRAGHRGTAQTIAAMRPLIDQGIKDQNINRLAIQIVRGTPDFQDTPNAQAIFNWVKQHIRFIPDPVGKEALRTPQETLTVGAGDCDCMTVLIATLCGTIGMPSRAITVSTNPDEPNTYSHVYPEVLADGQWLPMDCGRPNSQLGLSPSNYFLKKAWDLFGTSSQQVSGLSGYMGCPGVHGAMGRGSLGLAAYRSPGRRRGMGDIGDVTDALSTILTPQVIQSSTQGAAQIISATNGYPVTGVGSSYAYNAAGQLVPAANVSVPAGYAYNSSGQLVASASLTGAGISSNTLLLLVLLGAAFVVMR